MSDEVSDDAKGGGEHDDGKRKFLERWDGMSEAERSARAIELWQSQRGETRKNTELSERISTLESERSGDQEKSANTLEEIRDEVASIRAEKQLVGRQAAMIERALQHEISPELAVQFAATSDSDRTFDLAISEIERKVGREVNARLTQGDAPKAGPSPAHEVDISQFSEAERARMPSGMRDKAFEKYLENTV